MASQERRHPRRATRPTLVVPGGTEEAKDRTTNFARCNSPGTSLHEPSAHRALPESLAAVTVFRQRAFRLLSVHVPRPANATAATCNGTTCGFTCNPGYEPSGTQCVIATNLYVSGAGSDTNSGTQASPFRTWKRAAQIAQAGTVVNFAAGTYDVNGGDDFTDAVPNGVTLQRSGSGTVNFISDGQHSLVFAGSGTVQNITLTRFRSPLSATTGTQTVKGITITQQVDSIRVAGTAIMVISDGTSISGAPTENKFLVELNASGQLTLRDSTFNGTWTDCFNAETGGGIRATDSSTLSISNATCSGALSPCVWATTSARIGVTNATLTATCNGIVTAGNVSLTSTGSTFVGMEARDTSTWTITRVTVTSAGFGVGLNSTGRITFRNSRFAGVNGVGIGAKGTFDFGSVSSAGGNTFNTNNRPHEGLNVNVDGVTVEARGNQWLPGVQGASPSGTMPAAYVGGPADGDNYYIATDQSAIQF
jgi:hypothetical protein